MKNYFYMLFMSFMLMLMVVTPVLADGFDDVVVSFDMGIPNAPPQITPPDIKVESAYYLENTLPADAISRYAIPLDQLIPRPGWQSESAREAYNKKREGLLANEKRQ